MFEFHHLVRKEILVVADRLDAGRGKSRPATSSQIRAAREALYPPGRVAGRQLELLPC